MPFREGDQVEAIAETHGWASIEQGDMGIVTSVDPTGYAHLVDFPNYTGWKASDGDLRLLKHKRPERRTAKKLIPTTEREKIAVGLIETVTKGEGKFTAVKVESEGRLEREDHCTANCTMRSSSKPHVGCKYFSNVKVANDFILRHLSQYGLAKRCKSGDNNWSYLYTPKLPLVFSKVYTDSETEWTVTLLLKEASDVLYTPMLVDAFNALAEANGNGIDVKYSGMHTAFLQGGEGMYPDPKDQTINQTKMFENFAKSMRPLLPALYLLGANRIEGGKGVTRSTSPRQPLISNSEKYSAIAYRYGAVEFRIFDTCYGNRDQILDNIVVMAQTINKYWHKTYRKPNIQMDKPVYFGSSNCENRTTNALEGLYVVKEHIVLLNQGLRCIKPPYMTVTAVKKARHFTLTVRGIKDVLENNDIAKAEYSRHLLDIEIKQTIQSAKEFYTLVNDFSYRYPSDVKKATRRARTKANKIGKSRFPASSIEKFIYKAKFGQAYPLGED